MTVKWSLMGRKIAYKRWSLLRGFNHSNLTGKNLGFFENWSLMGSGHLREVISEGGSTGFSILLRWDYSND